MVDFPVHLHQHHATPPVIQDQGEEADLPNGIDGAQEGFAGAFYLFISYLKTKLRIATKMTQLVSLLVFSTNKPPLIYPLLLII